MDDIRFATTVPVAQVTLEEVTSSSRKTKTARMRSMTLEMPARPSRPSPAATTLELPAIPSR
jgi:hypothetical protein